MPVITIYAEEIETVILFKENIGRLDYLITHMEAVV